MGKKARTAGNRKSMAKRRAPFNMACLNDDEIVCMIRVGSAIDYGNKASKFSDDELLAMHRYFSDKGFRSNHAMEIAAFAPKAFSESCPMDQESIGTLKC